ncbi:MAG: hypothetical protein KBS76_04155 [Ruminococcus sp.]|nr:hypothetical protein [Candidatus Apopatosoma intestinale]
MTVQDISLADKSEQKRFILSCERAYQNQIRKIATALSEDKDVFFLMLTGGSCSGKTTSSELLKAELAKRGRRAVIVSIDDFYRDREEISRSGIPDYESVSAIDLDFFISCASLIQSGYTVMLPQFDFQLGRRSGFIPYTPEKDDLIVFEGIQALYPEVIGVFPHKRVQTVYTAVGDDLTIGETVFDAREIRLMRRIVRDYRSRSSSVGRTLSLWDQVIRNEERNILPNVQNPTYSVNSLLAYEVNVIKPFVLNKEMYDFSVKKERDLFEYWMEKLNRIEEIPAKLVPKNSVFREFIG